MRGVLCLLVLVCAGTAHAQTNPDAERFQAYLASPQHHALQRESLAKIPEIWLHRCPALHTNGGALGLIAPPTFTPTGSLQSAVWAEHFPFEGCGQTVRINFIYIARPGHPVEMIAPYPGQSLADPDLQRDASSYAVLAGKPEGCAAKASVIDTQIVDPSIAQAASQAHQPWHERWDVLACGRTTPIDMIFTPDATGTAIAAHRLN